MCSKAIVTNRELKNKVTGLDLYVSDYQEIPHRIKSSFLYHVIVITNLFYYKSRDLRESDVVQFMVSKTFEEFEVLYHQLYKRFPSVIFPELPKKSLFSNDTTAKFNCMNHVLRMVAATQKLCSSPMVIAFLKEDYDPTAPSLKPQFSKALSVPSNVAVLKEEDVSAVVEQDLMEEIDLFQSPKNTDIVKKDQEAVSTLSNTEMICSTKSFLVEEESSHVNKNLFPLSNSAQRKDFFSVDNQDLLNVDEDLDLLNEDDLLKMLGSASKKEVKVFNTASQLSTSSSPLKSQENDNAKESEMDFFKTARTKSIRASKQGNDLNELLGDTRKKGLFFNDLSVDDVDLFSGSLKKETVQENNSSTDNNSDINLLVAAEKLQKLQSDSNSEKYQSDESIRVIREELDTNYHFEADAVHKDISRSDDGLTHIIDKTDKQLSELETHTTTHTTATTSKFVTEDKTIVYSCEDPSYKLHHDTENLFISESKNLSNTNSEKEPNVFPSNFDNIDDIMNYIAKHDEADDEVSLGF